MRQPLLFDRILEHAGRDGQAAALDASGTLWTYAALAAAVVGFSRQLAGENLPPEGVAVLHLGRRVDAWLAGLALRRLGLDTIAMGQTAPLKTLALSGVCCMLVAADCGSAELARIAPPDGCRILRIRGFEPGQWANALQTPTPASGPSGAHILLTSGTTGENKKIRWEPAPEAASLDPLAALYGIDRSSRVYVADFPLSTAGGHRWPQIAWSQGGLVVIDQRADLGRAYRESGLTHAFATPFMLRNLLLLPGQDLRRNANLQLLVAGGALTKPLADGALTRLTPHLFSLFAATEASAIALTPWRGSDGPAWHQILPGREVEIADALDQPLPPGEVGALRVRALEGIYGYLDSPDATAAHFRDGWFYTGDLGVLDHQGRLALRGRSNDVINCQGNKTAPEPLELSLQELLGAEAVCVFATPGADQQDQLHVAIQSRRAITKREVDTLAASELQMFGAVRFYIVQELPRNDMGKFQRAQIRQMLQGR